MTSRTRIALIALLGVALIALSACTSKNGITSAWPKASAERRVPKPVGPPRWPLTGLDAPTVDAAKARVVSVKIENHRSARPQSGLDQADVVYETVTEGGITRFNALFQSKAPKTVGPVRSARASDFYLVPQYHALFAHVGGESNVTKVFANTKKYNDLDQFFNPTPYWRSRDRKAPHNMYVSIPKLRAVGVSKRHYPATLEIPGLAFGRPAKATTPTVTQLVVPFAPDNKVSWVYNAGTRRYARSINGHAHIDRLSGKQYKATNVAVLWAKVETRSHQDAAGTKALEIILAGSGRASIFHDGQRYDGTWSAKLDAPPTFRTEGGQIIKLAPGNTWFQVIANEQNIVMR